MAKIDKLFAARLRREIKRGDYTVPEAAARYKLPYQVVYRVATGETWGSGDSSVGAVGAGATRGRKSTLPLYRRWQMWRAYRSRDADAGEVARDHKVSRSTLYRATGDFELMLAHRIAALGRSTAKLLYGLTRTEIAKLDALKAEPLPPKLQRTVERDFAKLEQTLRRLRG